MIKSLFGLVDEIPSLALSWNVASVLAVLFWVYSGYYLFFMVKKPKVIFRRNDIFMSSLVENVGLEKEYYYPFFFAPWAMTQVLMFLIFDKVLYLKSMFGLIAKPVEEVTVPTKIGDAVLHFYKPPVGSEKRPVVLWSPPVNSYQHGNSCQTAYTEITKAGYEFVVFNRRGMAKPSLLFTPCGDPYVLEMVLEKLTKLRPERGVYLIGMSAGTAQTFRWALDRAETKDNPWDVRLIISHSPSYHTCLDDECHMCMMDMLPARINRFYLKKMHEVAEPELTKKLRATRSMKHWLVSHVKLSGRGSWEGFQKTCPGCGLHQLDNYPREKILNMDLIPTILFCARDDILFGWDVLKKYVPYLQLLRNFALVDMERGGHGTFMEGLWGTSYAYRMSIEIFNYMDKLGNVD